MLPYAIAPAGTTVIITVADLLRFARMHLDAGLTQDGKRFLSPESIVAMATETAPRCASNGAAVGLAWHLLTYGDTQILSHGGGSYGGASSLIVVPEKRF